MKWKKLLFPSFYFFFFFAMPCIRSEGRTDGWTDISKKGAKFDERACTEQLYIVPSCTQLYPFPNPIPNRVGNVVFVKLHIPYVKLLFMAEMFGLRLLTKATVDDDAASDEMSKWKMWKCFGYDTDLFPRKHGIHYRGVFKVGRLEGAGQ